MSYNTGKVNVEDKLLKEALQSVKKAIDESMTPKLMATAILNEIYKHLVN